MREISVFAWLCLAAVAQQSTDPPPGASISGKVLDRKTSEPIRKAEVQLTKPGSEIAMQSVQQLSTDESGKFRFEGIAPGRYQLSVTHQAYSPEPKARTIEVVAGQDLTGVVFKLTPPVVITGRIIDEDGDPVISCEVVAVSRAGGATAGTGVGRASTDDTGHYRMFGVPPAVM